MKVQDLEIIMINMVKKWDLLLEKNMMKVQDEQLKTGVNFLTKTENLVKKELDIGILKQVFLLLQVKLEKFL